MNRERRKVISMFLVPIKVILSLTITFGLFFTFSVLNGLFHGDSILQKKNDRSGPRVLIERITPPPPEPVKEVVQKMRTVSERSTNSSASTGSDGDSRFMPDLSLSGGDGVAVGTGGNGFADEIYEDGQTDERQVAISRASPTIPDAAKRARIGGSVDVTFVINREGRVQDIVFVKVPHKMYEQPIRSTLLTWRFKPAMLRGVPVSIHARQHFEFNLRADNE